MQSFKALKKITSILLSFSLLINCVIMPFCNFQDTVSAKNLYELYLQKDGDATVLEFIAGHMLNMDYLFEEDETDEPAPVLPQQQHLPQPIQITQGSLICSQTMLFEEKEIPGTPRVFTSFAKDTYKFQLSASVFHPPAISMI